MKIELPLVTGLPWLQPVVTAELVNVAPHLWGTFAVHRCRGSRRWQITHVETGFQSGPSVRSKAVAIRETTKFLARQTPADKAFRAMPEESVVHD